MKNTARTTVREGRQSSDNTYVRIVAAEQNCLQALSEHRQWWSGGHIRQQTVPDVGTGDREGPGSDYIQSVFSMLSVHVLCVCVVVYCDTVMWQMVVSTVCVILQVFGMKKWLTIGPNVLFDTWSGIMMEAKFALSMKMVLIPFRLCVLKLIQFK